MHHIFLEFVRRNSVDIPFTREGTWTALTAPRYVLCNIQQVVTTSGRNLLRVGLATRPIDLWSSIKATTSSPCNPIV